MQRADPKLKQAFKKAETRTSGFVLKNGILVKQKPKHIRSPNEFLIVLPDVCKAKVLKQAHDSVNTGFHTGYKRTMMRIWRVFYVPKSEIKKYVSTCEICQRLAPKFKRERAELYIPETVTEFGKTFVIDVMGGDLNRIKKSEGYHKYVLVCVCQFSRWVEVFALPNLKAKTLADVIIEQLVARYRCSTLVFDQQSGLMSQLMSKVLELLRIKANIAVAGYHTKTGLAERTVRTVENCLKPYITDARTNWKVILPWLAFQLRQLPCETTGVSPHEMVYGKNFSDALDDLKDEFVGSIEPHDKKMKKHVMAYMKE
jgi:Integrase zinc binding domain